MTPNINLVYVVSTTYYHPKFIYCLCWYTLHTIQAPKFIYLGALDSLPNIILCMIEISNIFSSGIHRKPIQN